MQAFPHNYEVNASATAEGDVAVTADNLPAIQSAAPTEFGGPGDRWSPEHLLTAAVADCFVLTFRAVAQASSLEWQNLEVSTTGTLDKVDKVMRFVRFDLSVRLTVPAGTDTERATRVLEKSEAACMITNSLTAEASLQTEVVEAA